ncbi:MAG: hypothetical protein O2978_05525 [Bacteroidetes bacterium]|nr:hypothetical protein [Bacteroidota bacterium]
MKRILILTTILIFACSSDDSSDTNDNSNQTFLERFDGVVWQSDDEDTLTIIDNDNYSWKNVFNGDCRVFYFGVINDNYEYGWNIIVNEYNILVLDRFDVDDNVIGRSTIIPSEDGNVLTETVEDYSDNTEYIIYANRTTLTDPCE